MITQTMETARDAEIASTDEPITLEMLADFNRNRAATYGLLARLYREEVDGDLLETMHGMRYPVHAGDDDADLGYYEIARYLSNVWASTLDELQVDYSRCFIGHGIDARGAAYPYESVYTSEKHLMMQEARDEVLAIYRSEGVDKASGWKENEDHIACELEFMQIMCLRAADCFAEGDESGGCRFLRTQANFLEAHLRTWVEAFCDDVRSFAQTGFYYGLACLTEGTLRQESVLLDELVSSMSADGAQA